MAEPRCLVVKILPQRGKTADAIVADLGKQSLEVSVRSRVLTSVWVTTHIWCMGLRLSTRGESVEEPGLQALVAQRWSIISGNMKLDCSRLAVIPSSGLTQEEKRDHLPWASRTTECHTNLTSGTPAPFKSRSKIDQRRYTVYPTTKYTLHPIVVPLEPAMVSSGKGFTVRVW